jgi:hypothetical protein
MGEQDEVLAGLGCEQVHRLDCTNTFVVMQTQRRMWHAGSHCTNLYITFYDVLATGGEDTCCAYAVLRP